MSVGFLVHSVRTEKPPGAPEHLGKALVMDLSFLRQAATPCQESR
jgi:hypothetical protein